MQDSLRKFHSRDRKTTQYLHKDSKGMTIQGNKLKNFSKNSRSRKSRHRKNKLSRNGESSLENMSRVRNSILNRLSKTLKGNYYGAMPHENHLKDHFQSLKRYKKLKKMALRNMGGRDHSRDARSSKSKGKFRRRNAHSRKISSRKNVRNRRAKLNHTADQDVINMMMNQ
jgi:hypothetical protein